MDKEYIGKVCLDLSMYSGRDLYSDGDVEDELLDIVKNNDEKAFPEIIEKTAKWPVFYHLSPQRGNIVEWLPLKGKKVLEVGSGCGAITGMLSAKAESVTCVELSKKRSMINAYRHKDRDNIVIHVGNFQEIEDTLDKDFDYIMLIGVLEYADSYIGGSRPQEQFLKCLKSHLKEDGSIAVAIENRYGLKYFAGAGEDHTGRYFDGIENYPERRGVRTFGIEGLRKIAGKAGFDKLSEYYPYPDYKFTSMIFSPGRLPEKGELKTNICNYDRERMVIFDETKAFDGISEDGSFRTFSNSYLLLLNGESDVSFVKYSSDRSREYAISTRICGEEAGKRVEKRALYKEGAAHIEKMIKSMELLKKQYAASGLEINEGKLEYEEDMPVAVFEYLGGKNLETRVERRLTEGNEDGFCEIFEEYLKRITPADPAAPVCRDMIFSNIISDNDRWTLIDYEWIKEEGGTAEDAALRTLYCYGLEHPGRNLTGIGRIRKRLNRDNISAALRQINEEEAAFQKKVTGGRLSLGELRQKIGYPVKELRVSKSSGPKSWLQVYEDIGAGFSEERSYMDRQADLYSEDGFKTVLSIGRGVSNLRLDPGMNPCIVRIDRITLVSGGNKKELKNRIRVNGKRVAKDCYVFADNDPWILIKKPDASEGDTLEVCMCVTPIPGGTARNMI